MPDTKLVEVIVIVFACCCAARNFTKYRSTVIITPILAAVVYIARTPADTPFTDQLFIVFAAALGFLAFWGVTKPQCGVMKMFDSFNKSVASSDK